MSLRTQAFALFGTLLLGLIALQALWVRSLTRELAAELGAVATEVGQAVVAVIMEAAEHRGPGGEGLDTVVERDEAPGDRAAGTPGPEGAREHHLAWSFELGGRGDLPEVERLHRGALDGLPGGLQVQIAVEGEERQVQLLDGGALPIPVRRSGVDEVVARFGRRMAGGAVVVVLFGLVMAALAAHQLTAPLRELATIAGRVGGGELGLQVPARAGGEVGAAVTAFNQMSARLEALDRETRGHRAREHLSEIGEIGRGLAHTLRNPLNALGLYLEEITAAEDPAARQELALLARERIRQVDDVIRSFLALASDGAEVVPVDVGQLAEDVALRALQAGRAGVAISVAPRGATLVSGVGQEIGAAIQALVVNAVEASEPGGRVEVEVGSEGNGVRVVVRDHGRGVAPEVRDRLFTPHVTTKPSGSGMGLFLAQRIATTRYDGAVRLEDAEGGGTRAVLVLHDRRVDGGQAPRGAG